MSSPTGTDDGAEAPEGGAIVYDLASGCTADDVDVGSRYRATVNGVVDYGVFVDLSDAVSGLVHDSNLVGSYQEGDQLVVEL
ncbi:RecJ like exonuclease, partial [Halobacteriales archaeon QH_8_67_36]